MTEGHRPRAGAVRARTLAAALAVTTGAVAPALLVGTLGERITTELQLGPSGLGMLLAVFFGISALLAPAGGRHADRAGWPAAIRRGGALTAVGLVVVAVAGASVPGLAAGLAVGGLAMAVAMPAGSLAIAEGLSRARQGLLFGLKQTAIPLAGLLAGAAVPGIALTVGWRWAFAAALALPAAAVALAVGGGDGRGRAASPRPERPPPAFRILALGTGAAAMAVAAMSTFVVVAAVDAGVAEGRAGLLVAAASALGLLVRVAAGWAADRTGSAGLAPVAGMLLAGAGGLAVLGWQTPAAILAGVPVAYGLGWGWPGLAYLGAVAHHREAPGAATGALQRGLSGGSALGPLGFGVVAEQAGLTVAWGAAAAAMALGGLLVVVARRQLGPAVASVTVGAERSRPATEATGGPP